jgi:hypothetical protein
VVIEAGVVAGYVIAWAMRKARRAAGALDAALDDAIDAGTKKVHTVVTAKLGAHPVLGDLAEEVGTGDGKVSELTRQQLELAVTAAAKKDDEFARAVTELVAQLRSAEAQNGVSVVAGAGARVFTGAAHTEARDGGLSFGQIGGDVTVESGAVAARRPDPSEPGRSRP